MNTKATIVTIAKNEESLPEWCKYHLDCMGFDRIVLFDDGGNPPVEDTRVERYPVEDVLTKFTYPLPIPRQMACYYWFTRAISDHEDYALFIDADEVFAGNKTVKEFLADHKGEICDFAFPWVFATSEEEPGVGKDKTIERFLHRKKLSDKHIKSMLFMPQHRYRELLFPCPHCAEDMNARQLCPWYDPFGKMGHGPYLEKRYEVDGTFPFILHYWSKSREEFEAKIRRGRPDCPPDSPYQYERIRDEMEQLWKERSVGEVFDASTAARLKQLENS